MVKICFLYMNLGNTWMFSLCILHSKTDHCKYARLEATYCLLQYDRLSGQTETVT